jgi:DUF3037 family protein
MKNQIPFQYSVLHYIHDSFTGEYLNIGLAIYSQHPIFFRVKLLPKYSRITSTFPSADGEYIHKYITRLQLRYDQLADKVNSDQATFDNWLPARVEELLASILPVDDSAIQFSPVRGGLSADLDSTFDDLYHRLVEAHLSPESTESRSEEDVWHYYSQYLKNRPALHFLRSTTIQTSNSEIELDHAWKNGKWKALQPLSFDLAQPGTIRRKALTWLGTNVIINRSTQISKLYYLLGRPLREDKLLSKAYQNAKNILTKEINTKKIEIIEEDAAEDFAREIAPKIEEDTAHEPEK